MNIVIRIVLFVLFAALIVLPTKHALHMFQQNRYELKRYTDWLKERISTSFFKYFKEFLKSFTKCIHIAKLENHLIFASINFRQEHMEKAIEVLVDSRYDEVVELIGKDEFIADPLDAYENKIFCKGAPLKTGVIWNKKYIEEEK